MLIRNRAVLQAAVLMLLAGVQAQYGVTLPTQSFCAVTGLTVKIPCTISKHYDLSVNQRGWYRVQSTNGEIRHLSEDPQYSKRVSLKTRSSENCELTVNDVRASDTGVYNFRFKTWNGGWISASTGVQLTVADLQVKVDPNTVGWKVKVTCSSTCRLDAHNFYWYRNGDYWKNSNDATIVLDSRSLNYGDSYSCSVSNSNHRSPSVCTCPRKQSSVLGEKCWGVTYTPEHMCALQGTSVDLSCSYKHPAGLTVINSIWFVENQVGVEPLDVSEVEEYRGRVQSINNNCSLTIANLREKDAQTYRFRIYTDQPTGRYTGEPGVSLSVTGLQVTESDYGYKTLSCTTTCPLSNNPTYIWYKNGVPVLNRNRNSLYLYVGAWEAGSYSCAVRGREDLRSPAVCILDENYCWSVTYSTQTICSLIGSSVDIHSYFTFPKYYKVTSMTWFVEKPPVDLKEDKEYQDRVQYTHNFQNHCKLTITNLREKDTQTYRFRFYTDQPTGKYTGEPGVSLSVTGLQVTVSDYPYKILSCTTTCPLSNNPTYIWYKNGVWVPNKNRNSLYLDVGARHAGSYSCAVRGREDLRSPAVCILDENSCWSVTYSTQTICSLIGSSVDIHSYFTFPKYYKVTSMTWFVEKPPVDLKEDKEYQDRVQYTHNFQNHCKLTITNLREKDTQTYRFRFYTDQPTGKYTGEPGVSLSVTGLQVTVSDYPYKILSCTTTCPLSNNPTYIWYKNGVRVPNENRKEMYVYRVDAGSYSCAVRGREDLRSPAVYPPTNTTAVLCSSGDIVEGDSVTLSCSTDANPPVLTYTWFKQSAAADTLMATGQNYSISNVSCQHSGLYYCTALNQLGHHNSTPTRLDVLYSPRNTTAVLLSSRDTVEGDSLTLSCSSDANPLVLTYTWFKQSAAADTLMTTGQNYSISNVSCQHSGLYYCTALNQLGHHNSTPTRLDVLYPPRNLSVTVVLPVSGDLITLLCTSDSKPVSSYTWHRKTNDGVMLIGNGTYLTLSSREDGFHYCTARNGFGSTNSSEWAQTSDNRAVKYVASGITVALVLISIFLFWWMRRRKPALRIRSEENSEKVSAPVYGNVSAVTSDSTQIASSEDQDDLQYSSIYFADCRPSPVQEVPLYSTVQLLAALKREEEEVEYATVSLVKSRAVREDELYSNLSKE